MKMNPLLMVLVTILLIENTTCQRLESSFIVDRHGSRSSSASNSHKNSFIPTALPPKDASELDESTKSTFIRRRNPPGKLFSLQKSSIQDKSGTFNDTKSKQKKLKKKMVYGSWNSPITGDIVTTVNRFNGPPQIDPVTGRVFWVEAIDEGTRYVIFHYDPNTKETVKWENGGDVRSLIHEYGGQAFVVYNNTIYFTSIPHLTVFKQTGPKGAIESLSHLKNRRYADGSYSPQLNALFWVVEDHEKYLKGESNEPENMIVKMDADTGIEETVMSRASFFAAPRISKDGNRLAWVQWNHPNMPWDKTRMFVAKIAKSVDDMILEKYLQHGSMMMPKWSVNNEIFYIHDMTGWWNLYVINKQGFEINLTPKSQEIGWPLWWLGWQAFDVHPQPGVYEAVVISGKELQVINTVNGESKVIETDEFYDSFILGLTYSKDGDKVYVYAGSSFQVPQLIEVDIRQQPGKTKVIRGSPRLIDEEYISAAQQIQFPTTDGDFAYGNLYNPKNAEYTGPGGKSKPPLIVKIHGGPTTSATTFLNPIYQFFTSRGYAVLDVDYRGSTGYGKLYQMQLNGRWGEIDVADAKSGAEYLISKGIVDKDKVCISGISAGAFTALNSLINTDTFKAGTIYFGISDLKKLGEETHKFESRYLDQLVGKLSENEELYKERSPIYQVDKLNKSALFFSGLKDPIVPPNQTLEMYRAVKLKGLPTSHIAFSDEGHGMQNKQNLKFATEAELVFYSSIFNLQTDVTSPIQIDNLNKRPKKEQRDGITEFILS